MEKASKCWSCKNCYGQCEWSGCDKPVPGWKAIETNILEIGKSYCVTECPKYKPDRGAPVEKVACTILNT